MKKTVDAIVFILSIIALVISIILLKIYGAYEISYGGELLIIDGGWFRIILNMFRVAVLIALSTISAIRLFKKNN